jgi:putative ABC transport system substrate-binding protein
MVGFRRCGQTSRNGTVMGQARRRQMLAALGAILATPFVRAQRPSMPRIGLLWLGSPEMENLRKALIDGLRSLDYVEGTSLAIEDRTSVGRYEQLDEAANDLVRRKIDVIVTYGATATQAAHKATSTIPIVMITGGDPVQLGFISSLSNPGGNVTGVTMMGADLTAKRVELPKEALPRMRQVAVLLNPISKAEATDLRIAQNSARSLDLTSSAAEVRSLEDLEATFSEIVRAKADAVLVIASTMFFANRKRITELALRHRLPTMAAYREFAEAGAMLSYGADVAGVFRQASGYVAKILKGAPPSTLPFEQSRKHQLIVNLKTARALGITVPQPVLLRADEVIE